jgi:hypothetical protein
VHLVEFTPGIRVRLVGVLLCFGGCRCWHGSRGAYNKAEYEQQRRHMLQEWADMIDAWPKGGSHAPTLFPPSMRSISPLVTISPAGSSAAARRGRELA